MKRKPARQMIGKGIELEAIVDDNCCHAGTTVCAGHRHAVGHGIDDASTIPDRVAYLTGCNIFALPTEGVANPVDEMKLTLCVEPHQVAATEPAIPCFEDIAQNPLLGFASIRIPFETAPPSSFALPMRPIASPISSGAQTIHRPRSSRSGTLCSASTFTSDVFARIRKEASLKDSGIARRYIGKLCNRSARCLAKSCSPKLIQSKQQVPPADIILQGATMPPTEWNKKQSYRRSPGLASINPANQLLQLRTRL